MVINIDKRDMCYDNFIRLDYIIKKYRHHLSLIGYLIGMVDYVVI